MHNPNYVQGIVSGTKKFTYQQKFAGKMPQIESMQRLENDSPMSMRKNFQSIDAVTTRHDTMREDSSWLMNSQMN